MILDRHIDYFVRAECERHDVDPARFVRVLDHLPRETLLRPLGLYPADFDLEAERKQAYDDGVEEGELKHARMVAKAIKDLGALGRTKASGIRALIQGALESAAKGCDDRDHFVELMFDAIDELVGAEAAKRADQARAKALAKFKAGRARRVAA